MFEFDPFLSFLGDYWLQTQQDEEVGDVRRVPVDSWNTAPSDVLAPTVVHQMYSHPGQAGRRYQSTTQGETILLSTPLMHTMCTVQY